MEVSKKLSKNTAFNETFKISDKRKKNEEVILRLLGLCLLYKEYTGNMKELLNLVMEKNKLETEDSISEIINTFNKTLNIVSKLDIKLFKPHDILSLAILDAIFVGTFYYLKQQEVNDMLKYQEIIQKLISSNDFQKNTETGKTHHTAPLKERIELAISEIGKLNE